LITKHSDLAKELKKLRIELAAYSEQDPVEVEKKAHETQQARNDASNFTDQIYSMESWLKNLGSSNPADMKLVFKMLYGDEYDEEEEGLREL
jgi:hypothetical protein